jgi:acetyltransferase-like isoleucine patch superfamily enzyme
MARVSSSVRRLTAWRPAVEVVADEVWSWFEAALGWVPGRVGSSLRVALYQPVIPGVRHVGRRTQVERPWKLNAGPGLVLSGSCHLTCTGGLVLGSDVIVGPGVTILTTNHRVDDLAVPIRRQGLRPGPVEIHDDVWLGANAVVVAGVTVGRGAVVGAGAVVTRDVDAMSIVGGVPARPIGTRDGS